MKIKFDENKWTPHYFEKFRTTRNKTVVLRSAMLNEIGILGKSIHVISGLEVGPDGTPVSRISKSRVIDETTHIIQTSEIKWSEPLFMSPKYAALVTEEELREEYRAETAAASEEKQRVIRSMIARKEAATRV